VKSGRLVPLAVAASGRIAQLPGVPTTHEAGLDFEASSWTSLFAPAATPRPVQARLAAEIAAAVAGALNGPIREQGFEPVGSSAEALGQAMAREAQSYRDMARSAGIKPQ
jgi:tripartite-type tricarboxylate transporter receptor subunit TctC